MKKVVGALGIIFGILFLSIEIYGFRVLQALEKLDGNWMTSAWSYAYEPPCAAALVLTVGVILFSLYLFLAKNDGMG